MLFYYGSISKNSVGIVLAVLWVVGVALPLGAYILLHKFLLNRYFGTKLTKKNIRELSVNILWYYVAFKILGFLSYTSSSLLTGDITFSQIPFLILILPLFGNVGVFYGFTLTWQTNIKPGHILSVVVIILYVAVFVLYTYKAHKKYLTETYPADSSKSPTQVISVLNCVLALAAFIICDGMYYYYLTRNFA
jgi:hypothetical protein